MTTIPLLHRVGLCILTRVRPGQRAAYADREGIDWIPLFAEMRAAGLATTFGNATIHGREISREFPPLHRLLAVARRKRVLPNNF